MVAVAPPSGGHGSAGAVAAAVAAVAAGAEQHRVAAQEAAMRPAVLPVAEVNGTGAAVSDAQLHWRRLKPPAQILLRMVSAQRRRRV